MPKKKIEKITLNSAGSFVQDLENVVNDVANDYSGIAVDIFETEMQEIQNAMDKMKKRVEEVTIKI